jgi:DNA polymerase III delta prime subunit
VYTHPRRQRIERNIEVADGKQLLTKDFIWGKGRGMLVMLHGEPGVGKTATAEAVA